MISWSSSAASRSRFCGHVALHHRQPVDLPGVHDLVEAARVRAEVEPDHLRTVLEQRPSRPGAEATEDAGDQEALGAQYTARPPERSKQAPVVKSVSSLARKHARLATSSERPSRPSGIFETM